MQFMKCNGACGCAVSWGTVLQARMSWVQFPLVSLEFFIDIILLATLWLWGRSASNRNEYQEYFLGGESNHCIGLRALPLSGAVCLEIWEPQPPGTLSACPGLCRDCITLLLLLLLLMLYLLLCEYMEVEDHTCFVLLNVHWN